MAISNSVTVRAVAALKATTLHFGVSVVVAAATAAFVFLVWFPFPYRDLAGGRELFLLVVVIDVICGPILTAIVFAPTKSRVELWRDLTLVAAIQVAALGYGMYSVWSARPLFLVSEVDRFKVIGGPDLQDEEARSALKSLTEDLKSGFFQGPIVVAIRAPKNDEERNKVLSQSVAGGRDYAQRPEFYISHTGTDALKSLRRARPLAQFLQKYPDQKRAGEKLAHIKNADIAQLLYLPVVAREDWIAVLDKQGTIKGFLKGDGF